MEILRSAFITLWKQATLQKSTAREPVPGLQANNLVKHEEIIRHICGCGSHHSVRMGVLLHIGLLRKGAKRRFLCLRLAGPRGGHTRLLGCINYVRCRGCSRSRGLPSASISASLAETL